MGWAVALGVVAVASFVVSRQAGLHAKEVAVLQQRIARLETERAPAVLAELADTGKAADVAIARLRKQVTQAGLAAPRVVSDWFSRLEPLFRMANRMAMCDAHAAWANEDSVRTFGGEMFRLLMVGAIARGFDPTIDCPASKAGHREYVAFTAAHTERFFFGPLEEARRQVVIDAVREADPFTPDDQHGQGDTERQ